MTRPLLSWQQANMDPRHRDCMAFVRVCSGRFERDMVAHHSRTGRRMRLSGAQRVFGRERETVDEAYPGDIVGIVNAGDLGIGDTLTTEPAIAYAAIPRFEPETFARLRNRDLMRTRQFARGLDQLEQEGVVQVLREPGGAASAPVLAAVGALQFDVLTRRLRDEYGVETALEPLAHTDARLVDPAASALRWPSDALPLLDREGRPVVLFRSRYDAAYFEERHPEAGLRRFAGAPDGSTAAPARSNGYQR
jgi:peptide chain release factor 3